MIARWLRRWLVGDPCSLCSLPVRREVRAAHLEWHRVAEVLAGRPAPGTTPRPVRPARRAGTPYLLRALDPNPRLDGGPE